MPICDIIYRIKGRKFAHTFVWFFIVISPRSRAFLITTEKEAMQLEVIQNPDESQIAIYRAARVIFAETYPTTLASVEAMASMIKNIMDKSGQQLIDIVSDKNLFDSLNENSPRHQYINMDIKDNRALQMCVRVVERMIRGGLPDTCFGATRFHRTDEMPDWATSRGYIADVDGLLFYL